jgi:hypothetical protein
VLKFLYSENSVIPNLRFSLQYTLYSILRLRWSLSCQIADSRHFYLTFFVILHRSWRRRRSRNIGCFELDFRSSLSNKTSQNRTFLPSTGHSHSLAHGWGQSRDLRSRPWSWPLKWFPRLPEKPLFQRLCLCPKDQPASLKMVSSFSIISITNQWQGVAMNSLEYYLGPPCPTVLYSVGAPPLKIAIRQFQGWPTCLILNDHLRAWFSTGGASDAVVQLTSALNFFKFEYNFPSP